MSDSDKHYAYLEDPDNIDLNNEFNGLESLDEDEVKNLKREYVLRVCLYFAWLTHDYQVGNAATQPSENSATSFPTSKRKLTTGRLKSSIIFMQRWVASSWSLVYSLTESTLASVWRQQRPE